MRSKSGPQASAEQHVREIRRQTRKRHSTEDKIRIVLEGQIKFGRNLPAGAQEPRASTIDERRADNECRRMTFFQSSHVQW